MGTSATMCADAASLSLHPTNSRVHLEHPDRSLGRRQTSGRFRGTLMCVGGQQRLPGDGRHVTQSDVGGKLSTAPEPAADEDRPGELPAVRCLDATPVMPVVLAATVPSIAGSEARHNDAKLNRQGIQRPAKYSPITSELCRSDARGVWADDSAPQRICMHYVNVRKSACPVECSNDRFPHLRAWRAHSTACAAVHIETSFCQALKRKQQLAPAPGRCGRVLAGVKLVPARARLAVAAGAPT
jgi:hypothetical protein